LGFNFSPKGWAFCNGQLISIVQNTALYSLLGVTFGGDGINTFGLPDLRGRTIVHPGQGTGLADPVLWGEKGGTQKVTLTQNNMPMHNHALVNGTAVAKTIINTNATGGLSNDPDGGKAILGCLGNTPYIYSDENTSNNSVGGAVTTISGSTGIAGASLPFDNRSPFLGIYTSIALYGLFPMRD
jgi:microcystin-dependent protein